MSEFQLQQANANIGLARSQFFPTIDLTSFLGGASLALNSLFTINTGIWATTAAIKLPILNLGIFADTEKAQAQYKAAYYNYIDTVKSSFAQVDDTLNYYSLINKSLKAQNQALMTAKKQYQFVAKKYELGSMNQTQTLIQKIKLDQARLGQLQVKSSQLIGLSLAYESLAAGYNNIPKKIHQKKPKKVIEKKLTETNESNKRIDALIEQMKRL
jgi:multidrug efflux system outer membrane protein